MIINGKLAKPFLPETRHVYLCMYAVCLYTVTDDFCCFQLLLAHDRIYTLSLHVLELNQEFTRMQETAAAECK